MALFVPNNYFLRIIILSWIMILGEKSCLILNSVGQLRYKLLLGLKVFLYFWTPVLCKNITEEIKKVRNLLELLLLIRDGLQLISEHLPFLVPPHSHTLYELSPPTLHRVVNTLQSLISLFAFSSRGEILVPSWEGLSLHFGTKAKGSVFTHKEEANYYVFGRSTHVINLG